MRKRRLPRVLASACASFMLIVSLYGVGGRYTLLGWNNLGMHCMDSDYTVFSILPPYNTVEAQLIDRNGRLVRDPQGITVSYEGVADPAGSINTTSQGKTGFWQYVLALYGASLPIDAGLAGHGMPGSGNAPKPMAFNSATAEFVAEGIPITPYDDSLRKNYYPLMHLVARDSGGSILAATDVVLPVSDEMDCRACHASDSGDAARPGSGWVRDPDPESDYRLNILLIHDQLSGSNPLYKPALSARGYDQNGLYPTVVEGKKPILCAGCHASNALPGTGIAGIAPLTRAVHSMHAGVMDPAAGQTLDSSSNRSACYRCHPGSETRCLRGVMGASVALDGSMAIQCQDCHGSMSEVGSASRQGWLNEPTCQNCHTGTATQNSGQIRYATALTSTGQYRQPASQVFATNANTPLPGTSLYRMSRGHGGLLCSTCHGSTHAEYPSTHLNDNIQSLQLQGSPGLIGDCATCHNAQPSTVTGGPHGMHPTGQGWANGHGDVAENSAGQCAVCHGSDFRGTILSRALGDRTFSTRFGVKYFWRGFQVGCYACHNGPRSESGNPNRPPVTVNSSVHATTDRPLPLTLTATDADGNALTLRVVSQPAHGTVALSGRQVTYHPEKGYAGPDTFTFSAWDGSVDSSLGRVSIDVEKKFYIPFYQESPGTYTGIAFSNYSDRNASLNLTAYGSDGHRLGLPHNPASLSLAPQSQSAKLASEIFGTGASDVTGAWIEVTGDNAEVGCFFQFGGANQLDGSVGQSEPSTRFRFTRVFEGPQAFRGQAATTYLSIANPGDQPISLTMTLLAQGQQWRSTKTLPAKGMLFDSVSRVFEPGLPVSGSFVDVEASGGAVGFELVQLPDRGTVMGLNAVPGTGAAQAYSAQLAVSPGYFTSIKLINTDSATRQVALKATADNGADLAVPVTVTLSAGDFLERDAADVFGFASGSTAIGSLIVNADGPGIIGDVIFGDPASVNFAAALALQTKTLKEAIFSHVANGQSYFTGLALLNPTLISSYVTIDVYSPQGARVGGLASPLQLDPGKRISKVLTELVPGTAGQMGGFVVVRSTQPLIAQEVFGDTGMMFLSAVPPAIIK